MKKIIDFCYSVRFFCYGAIVGAIPFLLMHYNGIVQQKSPLLFIWVSICTIGAITAQFKKEK